MNAAEHALGMAWDEGSAELAAMVEPSGLFGLDRKIQALTRVAALIATEPCVSSYRWAIDAAITHGATEEEIIDVLLAIAPIVGLDRVTSAAQEFTHVIGYGIARKRKD
jgi:4-carboxymuconolactone decarboxylase